MIATPSFTDTRVSDPLRRLRALFSLIRDASADDGAVVFTGDPGTGKSLLAAITHYWSTRADAPLVAVSCGVRPESALETELFGTRDSEPHKPGQLEVAEGGTLLLADVDLAPPRVQQRLASALRERRARHGSLAAARAIRPLATTTCDLHTLVAEGKFSPELLSQLEGVTIEVPAELLCAGPPCTLQSRARPSLDDRLRDVEAELIRSALRSTGGNKSRAATLLGIKRTTLTDRIERLRDRLGPCAALRDRNHEVGRIA